MTRGKWTQWAMAAVATLLLVIGCDRGGKNEQKTRSASQRAVLTASESLKQIAKNEPVIQPGSLVYLLLPIEQAKGLNMSQKKFVNNLAKIYAHEDQFADIEREFRALRTKHEGKNAEIEISAIDVVLREIQRFRSVFEGKFVLIQVPENKLSFPGAGWTKGIDAALRSYGYVFLELGGDSFHPASPPEINKTQWEQCKANRILAGKWRGAVQISMKEILLTGLKCFEQ